MTGGLDVQKPGRFRLRKKCFCLTSPFIGPIPHIAVVEKLIEALSFRQIGVVREEYAVSSDGMKMFGVMDLSSGFEGCRFHADCPIMPIQASRPLSPPYWC